MKRTNRTRRAFTLIELLVVLVILALLAGLVVPRFLQQTERGQVTAAQTQIAAFKSAVDVYILDHKGTPPNDLEDLISPPSSSNSNNWKGPYLANVTVVPLDPWDNPYIYTTPGPAGQDYEIISLGDDKREGGTGNAADISSIK